MKINLRKVIYVFILFVLCIIFSDYKTYADSEQTSDSITLKVAFYELDGFFEYDKNGQECGYGVDYLNELSKYKNIHFEYVPVDSWEAIGDMMASGEVDIRMPVTEPSTPSAKYSYTSEDILTSYHAIMTLKSRDDLYYEDNSTLSNLKVAVTENLIEKNGATDYLNSIGVYDNLVYYPEYNDCYQALINGDVDALISNIMDLTDDMKILSKFSIKNNYITMRKGDPAFATVNEAVISMKLTEPSFQSDLYAKYYPERSIEPFTKEESVYIQDVSQFTVAVNTDQNPVCYYNNDTASFEGIAVDAIKLLFHKIGIPVTFTAITTENAKDMITSGKADLILSGTSLDTDSKNFFTSDNVFDSLFKFTVITGTGEQLADNAIIGIPTASPSLENLLLQYNDDFRISCFDTNAEALDALKSGEINAFFNSEYVLDNLLENPRYDGFSMLSSPALEGEIGLCGYNNPLLLSIINKGITQVTSSEIDNLITKDTLFNWKDLSLSDRLYVYYPVFITALIFILLLALCFIYYTYKRYLYTKQIEQKSLELETANHAKTDFLSRMSHELRTPMNAILGMSALANDSNSLDESKSYVHQIQESSHYLLQIINDILDMSRIESSRIKLNYEVVDGPAFLQGIVDMIQPLADANQVNFHTEFQNAQTPWVEMDTIRSKQIYVNLLNNAIKFSPPGSTVSWIIKDTPVDSTHMRMVCTISDEGCGMSKEFLTHMYEPFEQERNPYSDRVAGTGLGLPIVKNLVTLMGGTITCHSELGKGTTFTINMIRKAPSSLPQVKEKNAINLDVLAGSHILLVEDNAINAKVAKKLLEKQDILVTWVTNGQLAVDTFSDEPAYTYDLILMDVRMPVMDGLEATRRIRAADKEDAKSIPILAMTADAFIEDRTRTIDAGMNEHLSKPIDPKVLYQELSRYLEKRSHI